MLHNNESVRSDARTKCQLKWPSLPVSWLPTTSLKLLFKGGEGSFPSSLTTAHEPYECEITAAISSTKAHGVQLVSLSPCNSCQAGDNIASIISLKSIWCRAAHSAQFWFSFYRLALRKANAKLDETCFYKPKCQTLDN